MEQSLGILKPDCLQRNLEQIVYSIIRNSGLDITFTKRTHLTRDTIRLLYHMCIEESFYPDLEQYMLSGPVEIFLVVGKNAIVRLNTIVGEIGSTNPSPHTIRGRFATSPTYNIIHATTNYETLIYEMKLFL